MYFRDYFLIFVEFSLLTYFFYFSYQALSQKEKDKIFRPGWPIYYSLYKYLQRTIYFIIFEKKLEQKWNLIFKKSTYTRKIEILKIRIKKRYNKNEMRKALDLGLILKNLNFLKKKSILGKKGIKMIEIIQNNLF